MYYFNARYYDPEIGQFISPDTIVPDPGNVFGYNRYMYTFGNPLNYTDPSGNDPWWAGTGPSTQHGDPREYVADYLRQSVYAPASSGGEQGPSLLERMAPDVVIYGAQGEISVIATLSGGRYTAYDFENLHRFTLNGLGGGMSAPGASVQVVQGIGYYQSNDPVFENPNTALAGQALEGSVSAGELIVFSVTYGNTRNYVDDPNNALRYGKAGMGLGAGPPVNGSLQGTKSFVVNVVEYFDIEDMTSAYLDERGSPGPSIANWIGFMQRYRQPEGE